MKAFLTTLFIIGFCSSIIAQNIYHNNLAKLNLETIPVTAFEQGRVAVKFHRISYSKLKADVLNDSSFSNNYLLQVISQQFNFTKVESIFKNVLNDELHFIQHKKYNLDLWFTITFDSTKNVKQLIKTLQKTNLFEVVEPIYKKRLLDGNCGVNFIPNDPRANEQWSYNNTGQGLGKVGKDIKLFDAWDIETGKPQVIVALHDMGVQMDHPDLMQNLLPNKSFNFIDNNSTIDPGFHGTHTAGTIVAVNNNGIGVSGIAGGNGNVNSGARLMSLEIYKPVAGGYLSGGFAESYVYAADNGAAISSNSWAYDEDSVYELHVIEAIDYFIENGGGTALQSGLVVFAAGNISKAIHYYPACYDRVICVAATNNRDEKAFYSTYGNWVDISAPGGEDRAGVSSDILSTNINSDYASFHGTSMACPHVSGVAALIASKLYGKASASDVRDIILSTTDNIDSLNTSYKNSLGTGRLNALKALQKSVAILNNNTIAPATNIATQWNCNNILISWQKNANNNNVVVVYSNTNDIGVAQNGTQYSVGNSFTASSKVVYIGNATSCTIPANQQQLHFIKVFSVDGNNNYSLGRTAEIVGKSYITASGIVQQNFDYPPQLFPTLEWQATTTNNNLTWTHTAIDTAHTGAGDDYSMCMYNYSYNPTLGAVATLSSPIITTKNTDSITLSFWYAYQYRNTTQPIVDSFEVLASTNCGNSYTSLWKNYGINLSTTTATTMDTAFYPFGANMWKQITIDVSSLKNSDNILFAFRNVNGKGNNLFLDNININVRYSNDASIQLNSNWQSTQCNTTLQPQITLTNKGNSKLTSAQISYSIDNQSPVTTSWAGSLLKDESTTVSLNSLTATQGNHILKIYSSLPNNLPDNFTFNDTVTNNFYLQESATSIVIERFEATQSLPQKWHIAQQPIDEITWAVTNVAGKNSNHCIELKNYTYRVNGNIDDLLTPSFAITNQSDSAFLTFDYAYALRRLTDSSFFDTLQIDYTTNCGLTWQTIFKKAGKALTSFNQTIPETYEFYPTQQQWQTDSFFLGANFNINDLVQVRFRNISNWGNSLYLDNIKFYNKTIPTGLQQNGYAIFPNPVYKSITVQHLQTPTNLKAIEIFNSIGKKVVSLNYSHTASNLININLQHLATGVYFVQLVYDTKNVVEKIVKLP